MKAEWTVSNCGRTLAFTQTPTRVVTSYQTTLEMMLQLGLDAHLVGRVGFDESPLLGHQAGAFAAVPELAPGPYPPPAEVLLRARPDFVFVADPAYELDAARGFPTREQIEAAGATVYAMSARCAPDKRATIEDVYTDIDNLGRIFLVPGRADALVEEMKRTIADVRARVRSKTPLRSLFYIKGEGPLVVLSGVYFNLPELAGAVNVFGDRPGTSAVVTAQEVVDSDPEVFVVDNFPPGPTAEEKTAFLLGAFPGAAAAKAGRVVVVDNIEMSPGIRNPATVRKLAKAFFPDVF